MMYNIPPDFSEKEQIVGGILTLDQLISIICGIGIAALLSLINFPLMGVGAIILGCLIGIPIGIVFACVKIHGLTLKNYIKYKRYHMKINKKLPNINPDIEKINLDKRPNNILHN